MATADDEFLRDEYLKLQDQYEDYDRRALQIKSWIGTAAIAGFALGTDVTKHIDSRTLLIIASIASCFWYLEAVWKTFQYAITDRIRIIEAHFRRDEDILFKDPKPFQIYHWWFKSYAEDPPIFPYETKYRPSRKRKRFWDAACQSFVHLPYSLIVAICLGLYLWDFLPHHS
jgi:hypothetical protein